MDNDQAIAASIERGIIGQTDLITSLSLAVIGGLLALMVQVKIHNASHPTNAAVFEGFRWFVISLGLAGLAILTGFLIYGMMIEMGPLIITHDFDRAAFSEQKIEYVPPNKKKPEEVPIGALRWLSITQAMLFLGSVVCATAVILTNRPTTARGRTEREKIR